MAKKIDKNDIDNILIYSDDRWSLVEESVIGKTPSSWWTASSAFYNAMPEGSVKAAHMPCALLYQVGEEDNQRVTCTSINVDVDKKGVVTNASISGSATVGGRTYNKDFPFTTTGSFHYPFGMRSADAAIPDASAIAPDDFAAFASAVESVSDKGEFTVSHIVVGTGGPDGTDGGLDTISQVLTALNTGDMSTASSAASGQAKVLAAEGYDDRDDESIGMRHRGKHSQSMKSRRDESKGTEKAMGDRPYSDVGTMDLGAESDPDYDPTTINPTTTPATPSGYTPAEMAAEDANIMDVVTEPGTIAGVQGEGSAGNTSVGEGHGVTESFGKSTWPVPDTLLSAEGEMESLEQATVADELTVETVPGGSEDALGGGPGISPTEIPANPSDYVVEDLDARIEAWMAEGETATHDPYADEVPYEGPGDFSGSEVSFDAERTPIGQKIKRPGALTRKAKRAGMSVANFSQHVLDNPTKFTKLTRQQAGFYHNVLRKGSKTSAKRSKVRADMRRKGYMMAESPVTWEDSDGLSSPSSPPDDIFMADEVDEIYGMGHIVGQTGSTWTTSPLMAEGDLDYASGYGQDSAYPSSNGAPVWYGSADTVDLPVVGNTDVRSATIGVGLGIGLMALIARFAKK